MRPRIGIFSFHAYHFLEGGVVFSHNSQQKSEYSIDVVSL